MEVTVAATQKESLKMADIADSTLTIIALGLIKGIGPKTLYKLSQRLLSPHVSANLIHSMTDLLNSIGKKYSQDDLSEAIEAARVIIDKCHQHEIQVIDLTQSNYPNLLKELGNNMPSILYARGNLSLLNRCMCVIGTRQTSNAGSQIAFRIAKHFSDLGWSVCNGLAEGIDYQAATANPSKIVGVLGFGLDLSEGTKSYVSTAEMVLGANGLLLSEHPPGTKGSQYTAIDACRIQAGVSKGTILVQSKLKGGSRFTVKTAIELNRPVGIIRPIDTEKDHPANGANIAAIDSPNDGIRSFAQMDQLPPNTTIRIINNREDYATFESLMEPDTGDPPQEKQLPLL
jgi:DNA processing protein